MDSLVSAFHVDWRLLLAQTVNFGIVFAVLYWFMFKPLFKTLAERKDKIAAGLEQAAAATTKLIEAGEQQQQILDEAKIQAGQILKDSREQADRRKQEMVLEAKTEIGKVVSQERQRMQQEKEAVLGDIRREAGELVIAATAKFLNTKADMSTDKQLLDKLLD